MGFGQRPQREGEDTEAIKRLFTPEFRNRLDAVIAFRGLTPDDHPQRGRQVRASELGAQLADKRVSIELDEAARGLAGREGLRPALRRPAAGARDPGPASSGRSPTSCCSASSPRAARSSSRSPTTSRRSTSHPVGDTPLLPAPDDSTDEDTGEDQVLEPVG